MDILLLVVLLLGPLSALRIAYVKWRDGIRDGERAFRRLAGAFLYGTHTCREDLSVSVGGHYQAEGSFAGKQVSVELRPSMGSAGLLTFQIQVPDAGYEFEVSQAGLLTKVLRRFGGASEGSVTETGFVLKSPNPERLGKIFGTGHIEAALLPLLQQFSAVRLRDGWLSVSRECGSASEGADEALSILTALAKVAELCQLPEVEVLLREKQGTSEGLVCPYCRDHLDFTTQEVSACQECQTLHHSPCMLEAGGCTVFACEGRGHVPNQGSPVCT